MNALDLAVRLIIDGYVVIPDAIVGDELQTIIDGFERQCAKVGKRQMQWDEVRTSPELVGYICHPKIMSVLEAYMHHFDQDPVFACYSGARDVGKPGAEPPKPRPDAAGNPIDPFDIRYGQVGWHDDVAGMRNPRASLLPFAISTLLYMDETYRDSGAYCAAAGSHHLARVGPNDQAIMAPGELVLDHCELRALPVKPGSIIMHRGHNWHGVMPVRHQRRIIIQTFCARSNYPVQEGHTQLTDEERAMVPADRHKYLVTYADYNAPAI